LFTGPSYMPSGDSYPTSRFPFPGQRRPAFGPDGQHANRAGNFYPFYFNGLQRFPNTGTARAIIRAPMDIQRPDQTKAKRKKRILLGVIAAVALTGITILLARLKPAVPTVEKNLVWMGEVKRGQMLRQVRGLGTLVPEEITWLAARTEGGVDKIVLRPGAMVTPDSVILILTNPDVVRTANDADSKLKAAESELVNLNVTLESAVLAEEATAAGTRADFEQAKLKRSEERRVEKECRSRWSPYH